MSEEKFRILYVDDEEHNLISFRAAFRREYEVYTALTAQEGVNLMREHNIHIIITDQRMPDMTGVEFLEKIRPENPDSIRMILTGFTDVEAIIQAVNSGGIFRYVTKPWDENELRMTIQNGINLYKLEQKNKDLINDLSRRVVEQERTLSLFRKYVPQSVIEKSLSEDENTSIFDGELKEVSVLFCDIRHFTEISSDLEPKDVVMLLNQFYTIMSESIKHYNGFVNKYVGDEILATFGAPVSYPEDHTNAVFCALDMIEKLNSLNELMKDKISQPIRVGIGINTGEVITGNLGTEDKIEYSITGDVVNMGKRIESLTKDSPNTILVNSSTYEKVNDHFNLKAWEPVMVKGKKVKLQVYEVEGKKF